MSAPLASLFVILRGNQETGPYDFDRLKSGLQDGEFFEDDLVKRQDERLWTSLSRLMLLESSAGGEETAAAEVPDYSDDAYATQVGGAPPEAVEELETEYAPVETAAAPEPGARANPFVNLTFIEVPWRTWFAHHPGTIAIACAGLAAGAAFFVRWPLAVCAPWMIAGVVAGFSMIVKQRPVTGVLACLAALLVPLMLLPQAPVNVDSTPEPVPVMEVKPVIPAAAPSTAPVQPAAATPAPVKSGVPALGLPEAK